MSGTYGTYAVLYYSLGYGVPLPIPYGEKEPPPDYCTGRFDAAGEEQLAEWVATFPDYDIAIRVPPNMVLLDFDMYGDKTGKAALDEAENHWGPLPPTYSTTARLDGSKRGLWYLPDGCNSDLFRSEIKFTLSDGSEVGNIDIIRLGHRYFMTAPSRHHTDVDAFWLDKQGNECGVPALNRDNFPELPRAWFDGLQKPTAQSDEGDWEWGPGGDAGFRAFDKGIPTRSPGPESNWHGEHYSGHIQLNSFHCKGRVSEAEYRDATQALDERYVEGATAAGEKVDNRFTKVHKDAISKVESKNDEEVEWELRNYPDKSQGAERRVEPDADFWDARAALRRIRALARARLTAPYPVMGEVLLRVAASTPPTVVLPPLRGGVASLNLYVALVGESGWGGKDTARDVAAMLISDRCVHSGGPLTCGVSA